MPVRDRRSEGNEEDDEDEDEEEDHEDVELVMKKLACMKKVRVHNCGISKTFGCQSETHILTE